MKFNLFVIACCCWFYILETGCLAQMSSSDTRSPPSKSNLANVETIQQQLQQLLDQEAQLKAMRQKLLQQLENNKESRDENTGSGIGKVTYGSAAPSSQPLKPKTRPIPTTAPQLPNSQFPFAEVYLESTGIVILNPKVPNRKVITN